MEFLPKDRDQALREIAERLYARLAELGTQQCEEASFLRNLIDMIERS